MGKVRWINWKYAEEFVRSKAAPEQVERIFATLSEADRQELTRPYQPDAWVDYGAHIRFLVAADRIIGRGDLALLREEGIYGGNRGLNSVYKIFMVFAKPQYLLKRTAQIWGQYYDRGSARVRDVGERTASISVTDYPDIPLHHDVENMGWMEEALKLCGCRSPRVTHPKCLARGDEECLFVAAWE